MAVTAELVVHAPRPELTESLIDGVNHAGVYVACRISMATRNRIWILAAEAAAGALRLVTWLGLEA